MASANLWTMGSTPLRRFAVILLACISLLMLRLTGDHLHLCFDGMGPAVSIHSADGDFHEVTPGLKGTHHDVDVDLLSALLKGASDLLIPLLLVGVAFLLFSPRSRVRWMPVALAIPDSRFLFLRPPLRGPPR